MATSTQMTTLSTVLEKLRLKKQDNEFKLTEDGCFTAGKGKSYKADELLIIKTYRFEGESSPSENAVLYVIQAKDGLIGYSMDAYGVYSNNEASYDDFIRKISVEDRDEQKIFGETPELAN